MLTARAPAEDASCGTMPCWRTTTQHKYKDKLGTPDGFTLLRVPAPPLNSAVRVELRNSKTGICWGADHTTVSKNTRGKFKAKGD